MTDNIEKSEKILAKKFGRLAKALKFPLIGSCAKYIFQLICFLYVIGGALTCAGEKQCFIITLSATLLCVLTIDNPYFSNRYIVKLVYILFHIVIVMAVKMCVPVGEYLKNEQRELEAEREEEEIVEMTESKPPQSQAQRKKDRRKKQKDY